MSKSWREKFTESDIKRCYQTLTKTQKIVLNEWSQITTNINELEKRIKEKTGKELNSDTIRQHQTGIKNKFNSYIKSHLLTDDEKKELQKLDQLEKKPWNLGEDEKAKIETLVVRRPIELFLMINQFKEVFNTLAEGNDDNKPSIEYELHTLIKSKLKIAEKIGFLSKIIEKNPEIVNETDEEGCTPLFTAVATNQPEIVEFLLEKEKIQIDIANYYGWTPFLKAANIGSLEIVKQLVASGTKIDAVTRMNANAVYEAAYGCDDINMVRYLVEELKEEPKLVPNIITLDQFTPLITAIWRRNYQIAQYLIQSGKLTPTILNARDIKDENALYKAISQGYFDLAYSLHEQGVEFHRPTPLSSPTKISRVDPQMASFFYAVERDDFETAKQLLEAEEDYNKKEQMVNQVKKPYERSLLSIAAEKGNLNLVTLLVKNKANLFSRNNHGRTPKDMVLKNISPEVYEYLEEQEQKVNPKPREDELRRRYSDVD